jgi:pSer/pThr/pTyr-binding forkhead associated (FHA) protein
MSLSAIEAAIESAQGAEPAIDHTGVEALPPNTALLLVKRGPNAGSRFLLEGATTTAGRHPESDIFLDDVSVSRRHGEFQRRGAQFLVRDAGSLNGTYVNRERIDEAVLSSGDEVQIGKFRLVYLSNALDDVPARSPRPERRSRRGWWARWRR